MSVPVIGEDSDIDFITDLQIIARREPGKGAAFQRMMDRASMTHQQVADAVECSRSTVSTWCSENRWPEDSTLRNALLALKIDRKLILREFGPVVVAGDTEFDPKTLAVTLFANLFGESDPFERERIIYDSLWEKALIAQGFKGMSDTRAFIAFTDCKKLHMEERRLRASEQAVNVTPLSKRWSQGEGVTGTAPAQPESDVPPEATNGGA